MLPLPGRPRIFRDAIHGDIGYPRGPLRELLQSIIDTTMFQRLRHIRQNGVLHLVFPGAEHSRFSHSMGVAWVAGKIFDAAVRNTQLPVDGDLRVDRDDTILAALLHDVGHGPFSHTLEEILKALKVPFDHERMTKRVLVDDDSEIAKLLGKRGARLVPFIDKSERQPSRWFHNIVSSALDADRLDYLLRDSRMAGVWTNQFDLDRLIGAMGIHDEEIVIDARARDVVESYLLAMEQMYASVYYHRTNRSASFLLSAVIQRAVDLARSDCTRRSILFPPLGEREDPLWRVVELGQDVPLADYASLDENHVWSLISRWTFFEDETLAELASNLKQRRLPKAVVFRKSRFVQTNTLRKVEEHAKQLFRDARPDRDPKYYIRADKPTRKAYAGGSYEEGYVGSIKLLQSNGSVEAIEESDRSIAKVFQTMAIYPSLIVPDAIRPDVLKYCEA